MTRYILALVALVTWQAAAAHAADPYDVAIAVDRDVLVPRYHALSEAFSRQKTAWSNGCGDVGPLVEAFHAASDAWAGVEHVHSGPGGRDNRPERIDFWPDPRNSVEKGLSALLSAPDESALAPERFESASVAVQGLPVLERLLFTTEEPGTIRTVASLDRRRCAIGTAVATNLAKLASLIDAEWTDPASGAMAGLVNAKSAASSATPDKSAATAVLTDFVTLFQAVVDRKLLPLYGGKGKPANPRAAESWRSGRSERNIVANLEAAKATALAMKPFAPASVPPLVKQLDDAIAAVALEEGNPRGFAALAACSIAKFYATMKLPQELDIPLGFNSLDGD